MTNTQVAEAFLQGKEGRSANMTSTGRTLFSYKLEIAEWYNGHISRLYTERRGHSVTTQRHMRELERAMRL